jgi:hypothetical protein
VLLSGRGEEPRGEEPRGDDPSGELASGEDRSAETGTPTLRPYTTRSKSSGRCDSVTRNDEPAGGAATLKESMSVGDAMWPA